MTREQIDNRKYKVCCPMCDNIKCVRGTSMCEAEIWKREKLREVNANDKSRSNRCVKE